MYLTSNHSFRQKYESSNHNIAFSSIKVILSESGEKYSQIKHCVYTGGSIILDRRLSFSNGGNGLRLKTP